MSDKISDAVFLKISEMDPYEVAVKIEAAKHNVSRKSKFHSMEKGDAIQEFSFRRWNAITTAEMFVEFMRESISGGVGFCEFRQHLGLVMRDLERFGDF